MSKPLNLKEHNRAFVQFLIFFLVTLAMAVSAIHFDFRIHKKELSILRERSHILRNQQINQENYKKTLNDVLHVIDKLDSGKSEAMIRSELTPKLNILYNTVNIDDSASSQRLNMMIYNLVNKYGDARFDLFELGDAKEELDRRDVKISTLSKELQDCRDRVNFNNNSGRLQ
jgi:Type VI secretion system, TssO